MISNKYRQELIDFLGNVLKDIDIQEVARHKTSAHSFYSTLFKKVGCTCDLGASKIVLFFEEFDDVVIKIPFTGQYMNGEYEEFSYAGMNIPSGCLYHDWDYCEAEEAIYQEILSEYPELADFFCETEYLMSIQDHPIYVQDRVKNITAQMDESEYVEKYSPSKKSIKIVDENFQETSFFSSDWDTFLAIFGVACDKCGFDLVKDLCDFCDEYIEDIHDSNFGFNSDGIIKIFDYCGFND